VEESTINWIKDFGITIELWCICSWSPRDISLYKNLQLPYLQITTILFGNSVFSHQQKLKASYCWSNKPWWNWTMLQGYIHVSAFWKNHSLQPQDSTVLAGQGHRVQDAHLLFH
jgi:hypothetical protein